jgi:hypothetical protein
MSLAHSFRYCTKFAVIPVKTLSGFVNTTHYFKRSCLNVAAVVLDIRLTKSHSHVRQFDAVLSDALCSRPFPKVCRSYSLYQTYFVTQSCQKVRCGYSCYLTLIDSSCLKPRSTIFSILCRIKRARCLKTSQTLYVKNKTIIAYFFGHDRWM